MAEKTYNQPPLYDDAKVSNLIRVGHILLDPSCPANLLQFVRQNHQTLAKSTSRSWTVRNMPDITRYIVQWGHDNSAQFYANYFQGINICQQIQDISFPYLKEISLRGNCIESVQCISRIYWPNLQSLSLWENNIISIRALRKMNAPKLNWIDLKKNLILDHASISQIHSPEKKLKRVHLTAVSNGREVMKMEAEFFQDLSVRSPQFLRAKGLSDQLRAKRS